MLGLETGQQLAAIAISVSVSVVRQHKRYSLSVAHYKELKVAAVYAAPGLNRLTVEAEKVSSYTALAFVVGHIFGADTTDISPGEFFMTADDTRS